MGIRFRCPSCGKKIHVKDFLAGKRGICPKCEAGVDIPLASQLPPGRKKRSQVGHDAAADDGQSGVAEGGARPPEGRLIGVSETPTIDPLVESPDRHWFVGAPDGRDLGPLSAADVRTMLDVGSIRPESSVRRDDWIEPMAASTVWRFRKAADPFDSTPVHRSAAPSQADSGRRQSAAYMGAEPLMSEHTNGSTKPDESDAPQAFDSPTIHLPPPAMQLPPGVAGGPAPVPATAQPVASPYGSPHGTPPWPAAPQAGSSRPVSPYAAVPAEAYVATPVLPYAGPMPGPESMPADDSAAPDSGLYYSRGSNASYLAAILILVIVVAVLAVAAYRVVFDPPAWLRPQTSATSTEGSVAATLPPFLQRNRP